MRSLRTIGLIAAMVLGPAGMVLGLSACTAEAHLGSGPAAKPTDPPPPPPAGPVDTDGDGINDDVDKCPSKAEDGKDPDPKDGCPSEDPDGDGIKGDADKCPTEAETKNGYQDEDGCPDTKPDIYLGEHEIEYKERIQFRVGSSQLDPKSDELIGKIADVIKSHPELNYIEVAGHTDKQGSETMNVKLSKDRAKSVVLALIKKKVSPFRLGSQGYGPYCPRDPAETPEAFEKNRRVDFVILRRGGKELTPNWDGCDAATAKKMKPLTIPKTAPKNAN
jgi:OmpA-OmpF porin, OOP family